MKPKRLRMLIAIVLLAIASPLLVMALYVEDWSRDLTTNQAHTAPGGKQEPLRLGGVTPEEIDAASKAVERLSQWRLANEKPLSDDSPLPALLPGPPVDTHHFVRTTGLMRYKDDVWVVVTSENGTDVQLFIESRSRVGKGDLGQNPRNIAELKFLLPTSLDGD